MKNIMNSAPIINQEKETIKSPSEIEQLNETVTFLNAVLNKLSDNGFSELFDSFEKDPEKAERFVKYSQKYKEIQDAARSLNGVNKEDIKTIGDSLESIKARMEESEK